MSVISRVQDENMIMEDSCTKIGSFHELLNAGRSKMTELEEYDSSGPGF